MRTTLALILFLASTVLAGMKQLPGETGGYWFSPIRESIVEVTLRAFVDAEGNAMIEGAEIGVEVQAAIISYDLPLLVEALQKGVALLDSVAAGHEIADQLLGDWRVEATDGFQGIRLGFVNSQNKQAALLLDLADYRRASKKVNPRLNPQQAERLVEILQQAGHVQQLYLEELKQLEQYNY